VRTKKREEERYRAREKKIKRKDGGWKGVYEINSGRRKRNGRMSPTGEE
jgi:hypothetical protein